jgi:hypothetical protein
MRFDLDRWMTESPAVVALFCLRFKCATGLEDHDRGSEMPRLIDKFSQ